MPDVEFTFGNLTQQDIGILSVDDFKNKCEKEAKKLIQDISSISKEECEKKDAYYSKFFKQIKDVHRITRISKDLNTKYQFFYNCAKEYQNELRKKIKESS
jgi:hypothetical protein